LIRKGKWKAKSEDENTHIQKARSLARSPVMTLYKPTRYEGQTEKEEENVDA
jgi:hypothetical protein